MALDTHVDIRLDTRTLRRWKAAAKRAKLPLSHWIRRRVEAVVIPVPQGPVPQGPGETR